MTDWEWENGDVDDLAYEEIRELTASDIREALAYIDFPEDNMDVLLEKLGY